MCQSSHEEKQKTIDQNLLKYELIWMREKEVNQNDIQFAC